MTISDRVRVKNVRRALRRLLPAEEDDVRLSPRQRRMADAEAARPTTAATAATLLPYNLAQRTVVLVRQFRYPAYVNGYDDLLIEAAAGVLDDETPEERIRAEAEEETAIGSATIRKIFEAFMSPGAVTEKLHFFVAEYDPSMRDRQRRRPRRRRRGHRGAGAADR